MSLLPRQGAVVREDGGDAVGELRVRGRTWYEKVEVVLYGDIVDIDMPTKRVFTTLGDASGILRPVVDAAWTGA